MFKVIKFFVDLQDNYHPYKVGDEFPRKGLKVSDERIAELSGKNNKQGQPLIAPVEDNGEKSLEKMKIEDLQAYAKEKGIDLEGVTKKADIIAKIQEAEAAAE